jgi:hypothetical protein
LESYGLEEPPVTPPPPPKKVEGIVSTGQPMTFLEPRVKPKPLTKVNNPFRGDDGFGTLLGSDADEPRGLGNRRRR